MSKIFDEAEVSWLITRWQREPEHRDGILPDIISESQRLMDLLIARVLGAGVMDLEDWRSELKLKLIKILPDYDPKRRAYSFIFRSLLNHILSQISRDNRRIHLSDIEQEDFELAENKLRKLEHEFEQNSYTWN